MTRRIWLCLAVALAACGRKAEFPPNLFPETAAGGWRRISSGDSPASPDPVPRNEVEQTRTASYAAGSGTVDARVYQLTSASQGVDLAQRWHPSADTVFFNQGVFFVVVKWQSADRHALQEFVTELEAKLTPPKRR